MLSFLPRIRNSNKFLFDYRQGSNPSTTHLRFIFDLRFISKIQQEKPTNNHQSPLTISYLTNSCGLSPQSALHAAKRIQLKTTENADSVLTFLKSHSFTNTQITKLITKSPSLLLSSVEKTLKPRLDFFVDVGFSFCEFASLACTDPILFRSSLQNRIKPNFELLSSMLDNNKKLLVAFHRSSRLFSNNLETNFFPNVRILQSYGLPTPNIAKFATVYPRGLMINTMKFAVIVESIKKFGFDPLACQFVLGVHVMSATSPLTWERKLDLYKSFGWSEEEIMSAFTKHPNCMLISDKKIKQMIDFYVNELHWASHVLVANPKLLCHSLESRVLPRCCVLSVLSSKGLIKRYPCVNNGVLRLNENKFYNKYVSKYMDQVPEVLEAYKGNLQFMGFERGTTTVQGS